MLVVLLAYTVMVIVSLYFTVELSVSKQEVRQSDFQHVVPTARIFLRSDEAENKSFIFTNNVTVSPGNQVSGVHGLIPNINCSDNDSLPLFQNKSGNILSNLAKNKDFVTHLLLSSENSNESVTDQFIANLCKPGTFLKEEYRRTLAKLVNSTLVPATVSPKQVHKQDTMKYYHSILNDEIFSLQCSTCALVSSSGRILGSGAGEEIDKHSCVIRMNHAPVKGFQRDVGSRTTVRVGSFVTVMGMKATNHTFLLGSERGDYNLYWGVEKEKHKKLQMDLKRAVMQNGTHTKVYSQKLEGELLLNSHFREMTGQDLSKSKSWLSTGWFTFELVLDMCDKLDVYGMVPEDYCKSHRENIKYHYYQGGEKPTECGTYESLEKAKNHAHRFMTEKAVFAKWGAQYNVSFYHPSWNLSLEAEKELKTPFIINQKKKAKTPVRRPR